MYELSSVLVNQLKNILDNNFDAEILLVHVHEALRSELKGDALLQFLCENGFNEGSTTEIHALFSVEDAIVFPRFNFDPREFLSFLLSYRDSITIGKLRYLCSLLRRSFHQLCIDVFRRKYDTDKCLAPKATREVLRVWCEDVVELLRAVVFPNLLYCDKQDEDEMNVLYFKIFDELELLIFDISSSCCASIPYIAVELSACFPRIGSQELQCEWVERAVTMVMFFFPKGSDAISVLLEMMSYFTPICTIASELNEYSIEPDSTFLFPYQTPHIMNPLMVRERSFSIWHKNISRNQYRRHCTSSTFFSLGILSMFKNFFSNGELELRLSMVCALYTLLPFFVECLDISIPYFTEIQLFLSSIITKISKNSIRCSYTTWVACCTESLSCNLCCVTNSKQYLLFRILQQLLDISLCSPELESRSSGRSIIEDILTRTSLKTRVQMEFLIVLHNPYLSINQHFIRSLCNTWKMYNAEGRREDPFFENVFPKLMIETISTCVDKTFDDFNFIDTIIRLMNFFAVFISSDRSTSPSRCIYEDDGRIYRERTAREFCYSWHTAVLHLFPILEKCEIVLQRAESENSRMLDHFSLHSIIEHMRTFYE